MAVVHPKNASRDVVARSLRLPPELMLLSAVIRQMLDDARSSSAAVREEALTFLKNTKYVSYWDSFLGLDGALLRAAAALVDESGL